MSRVKSVLRLLLILAFGVLLHYALPQHDVARITSTEVIRMDFSGVNRIFFAQSDSGTSELSTRDMRLINTVKKKTWLLGFIQRDSERVMVFRNEDTGWIWPPYFKFDSSDLQAQASANISAPGQEQWVVITHYGWRNRLFTIYPNAIGVRPIDGPDVTIIPWFNIGFFIFLAAAIAFLRAAWLQFRERTMDPMLERASDRMDEVEAGVAERRGRFSRWLGTWRAK
ncbi:DUF1523 family protein [Mesobacterium pallidum]|uniref:DUF1523 family protein n=1 Tax=Mesobacterium pallidum TaxID=2872037 RepID=UPI001EE35159|nr:DUF1523 family protein [Mesobacterium pallidum]